MTPQEKAKELIDRFKPRNFQFFGSPEQAEVACRKEGAKTALIAVEELENETSDYWSDKYVGEVRYANYWQLVKQEIEKL